MIDSNRKLLLNIESSSKQVATGSEEVAHSSQYLAEEISNKTLELNNLSSTIHKLSSQIIENVAAFESASRLFAEAAKQTALIIKHLLDNFKLNP